MSDKSESLVNNFKGEFLNLNSKTRRLFTIFSSCFQIYLYFLLIILFCIDQYWPRHLNLRENLSAQRDFGEPSSLVVPASFISALITYLVLRIFSKKVDRETRNTILIRIFPTQVFSFFVTFRYLLAGNWGQYIAFNKSEILDQIVRGSIFTLAFIHLSSIVVTILITYLFRKSTHWDISPKSFWLIPPLVYSVHSAFYFQALPSWVLMFMYLAVCTLVFLLYLFSVHSKNRVLNLAVLIGIAFPLIAVRSPNYLLTWRPEFVLLEIHQFTIIVFILIFLLILASISWVFCRKDFNLMSVPLILAMWATISRPVWKTLLTPLDNYHFGELLSPWFNVNNLHLSIYRDFELPRGILVNYIPAVVTDFLGGSNPEIFNFYYVLSGFAFTFCIGLVWMKQLSLGLLVPLVLILPPSSPNTDTFLYSCLVLVTLIVLSQKARFSRLLIPALPFILLVWLLMMPGHAIVFGLAFTLILFYSRKRSFVKDVIISIFSLASLLATLTLFGFNGWLSAFKWVSRNAQENNVMFGDQWFAVALQGENFPVNMRFLALLIPVISAYFYLSWRKDINYLTISLLFSCVLISLLSSSRWYGRVDSSTLSRIGLEALMLLLLVLVPAVALSSSKHGYYFLIFFLPVATLLSYGPGGVSSRFEISNFRESTLNSANIKEIFPEHESRGTLLSTVNKAVGSLGIESPKVFNVTGASAIDFYLQRPSIGGITSPYQIASDAQEADWLSRLKLGSPDVMIGGYGDLGSQAFDNSSFSGRAPKVFSWLQSNFTPIKCDGFFLGVRKNIPHSLPSKCYSPDSQKQELDFWNDISSVTSNKQESLISWGKMHLNHDYDFIDQKTIRFNPKIQNEGLSVNVICPVYGMTDFILSTYRDGEILQYSFSASTQTGTIGFNPYIFPITNMSMDHMDLKISSGECRFK